MKRWTLDRFATDIVGVGAAALDGWSSSWRDDPRCRVIHAGYRMAPFADAIDDPIDRSEVAAGPEVPMIVSVGRLDFDKDPELAVDIVGHLSRRGTPAHLVFVGDGSESRKSELADRATRAGVGSRVHLIGPRPDVLRIVAAADVMLLTSRREGVPGVVAEAVGVGTPVVARPLPGVIELAEEFPGIDAVDPNAGLEQWARAIERCLAAPRGAQARRRALDRFERSTFTIDRAAAAVAALYMGNPPPTSEHS